MKTPHFPSVTAAVSVLMIFCTPALAQYGDLLRRIPDGANVLVMVDVTRLHETPLAKNTNWRASHEAAFQAGLLMIPPQADKFVAAAKMDFESMHTEWEVALMTLDYEPTIAQVATRYQGTVDRIEGRNVAVLPGDTYVVQFGPRVAAVGMPAIRQDVTRWIRRIDNNSLQGLSNYLGESEHFAEQNAHILMALDLEGVMPAEVARQRLEGSELLEGKDVDLDALSRAIASLRGVSLGINVGESRSGALKVDFNEDVSILKGMAKPILLHALANHGAMIDEFDDWTATVVGKQVFLQGILLESGMRRLMTLLSAPVSLQESAKQAANEDDQASQQRLIVTSSQQYFKSVSSLVDDLKHSKRGRQTFGQIGVWFGRFADKIDRLSMVNVDDALLDYGQFVSQSLRQGQVGVQESAARSRIRQQEVPEQYDVYGYSRPIGVTWSGAYSWNGWAAVPNERATAQLRTQVRTQERLQGNLSANQILQEIDNATLQVRRDMTQKYNADF